MLLYRRLGMLFCVLLIGVLIQPVQAQSSVPYQTGFPDSEPYGSFFASPSVVDLNNDGKLEVLTADSTGCIWGWDQDGKELAGFPWKTGTVCDDDPRINSSLAIGDIDNDGKLEVVAGTRGSAATSGKRGKVFVFDNQGRVRGGWPREMAWANITNGNEPEFMSVTIANIVGDSRMEVIGITTNEAGSDTNYAPNVYAWSYNGATVSGFPTSSHKGSGAFGQVSAADIDNDGYAEILMGRDELYFYAYNGKGQLLSGWPLQTYLDESKRTWGKDKYIEYTRVAPAIGDLDNDGKQEIVFAGKVRDPLSNHEQTTSALLVVGADGKRKAGWSVGKTVGRPLKANYFTPNNPVALADFENDGKLEIVVTYDDGTIRAYKHDGTQLWSYNYTSGKKLYASEVAIGDVTGDGKVDIVFGTYSFDTTANTYVRLYALNTSGANQAPYPLKFTYEPNSTNFKGISAGPTLADLDRDGDTEILAHSKGGILYVWDTPARYRLDRMPWPTARQNNYRNGKYTR